MASALVGSKRHGLNSYGWCWIKPAESTVNDSMWAFFYWILVVIFGVSLTVLIYSRRRLSRGLRDTYEARTKTFRHSASFLAAYTVFWLIVGIIYWSSLPTSTAPTSSGAAIAFALFFTLRTVPTACVWALNHNLPEIAKQDKAARLAGGRMGKVNRQLQPHLNQALRKEVLHYTTLAIRLSIMTGVGERAMHAMVDSLKRQLKAATRASLRSTLSGSGKATPTGHSKGISQAGGTSSLPAALGNPSSTDIEGIVRNASLFAPLNDPRLHSVNDTELRTEWEPINIALQAPLFERHGPFDLGEYLSANDSSGKGATSGSGSGSSGGGSKPGVNAGGGTGRRGSITRGTQGAGTPPTGTGTGTGAASASGGRGPTSSPAPEAAESTPITPTSAHEGGVIKRPPLQLQDLAPQAFGRIRDLFGITPAQFLYSLSRTTKERFSEGASGAFMCFSHDMRFVIKTMEEDEAAVLRRILPSYLAHLRANKDTLIIRFYACMSLRLYSQTLYFVVMENVFPTRATIHERFDLKGSWVGRSASKGTPGTIAYCRYCNEKFKVGSSGRGSGEGTTCSARPNRPHVPNSVLKDNDLTYKLRLAPDKARRLGHQLRSDVTFLAQMGVMDYSLLVGVHNRKFRIEEGAVSSSSHPHANGSATGSDHTALSALRSSNAAGNSGSANMRLRQVTSDATAAASPRTDDHTHGQGQGHYPPYPSPPHGAGSGQSRSAAGTPPGATGSGRQGDSPSPRGSGQASPTKRGNVRFADHHADASASGPGDASDDFVVPPPAARSNKTRMGRRGAAGAQADGDDDASAPTGTGRYPGTPSSPNTSIRVIRTPSLHDLDDDEEEEGAAGGHASVAIDATGGDRHGSLSNNRGAMSPLRMALRNATAASAGAHTGAPAGPGAGGSHSVSASEVHTPSGGSPYMTGMGMGMGGNGLPAQADVLGSGTGTGAGNAGLTLKSNPLHAHPHSAQRQLYDPDGSHQAPSSSSPPLPSSLQPLPYHEPFFRADEGGLQCSIIEGPGVFYMGIIDILQEWSLIKKAERWLKRSFMCQDARGMSVMPPGEYAARFDARVIQAVIEQDTHVLPVAATLPADRRMSFAPSKLQAMGLALGGAGMGIGGAGSGGHSGAGSVGSTAGPVVSGAPAHLNGAHTGASAGRGTVPSAFPVDRHGQGHGQGHGPASSPGAASALSSLSPVTSVFRSTGTGTGSGVGSGAGTAPAGRHGTKGTGASNGTVAGGSSPASAAAAFRGGAGTQGGSGKGTGTGRGVSTMMQSNPMMAAAGTGTGTTLASDAAPSAASGSAGDPTGVASAHSSSSPLAAASSSVARRSGTGSGAGGAGGPRSSPLSPYFAVDRDAHAHAHAHPHAGAGASGPATATSAAAGSAAHGRSSSLTRSAAVVGVPAGSALSSPAQRARMSPSTAPLAARSSRERASSAQSPLDASGVTAGSGSGEQQHGSGQGHGAGSSPGPGASAALAPKAE